MGKASREKRERRERGEARFASFCPGMLDVLSIGKGELTIRIGDSQPDRDKARRIIEEMLQKGYTIFVEIEHYGPVKVTRFDPQAMTYIVADLPDDPPPAPGTVGRKPAGSPGRRRRETRVPVTGSKATAVGRTAGG